MQIREDTRPSKGIRRNKRPERSRGTAPAPEPKLSSRAAESPAVIQGVPALSALCSTSSVIIRRNSLDKCMLSFYQDFFDWARGQGITACAEGDNCGMLHLSSTLAWPKLFRILPIPPAISAFPWSSFPNPAGVSGAASMPIPQ